MLIGCLLTLSAGGSSQTFRYFRNVQPTANDGFSGRYELAPADVKNVAELFRFTYSKNDRLQRFPIAIAHLEQGALSDNYSPLGAAELRFKYDADGRTVSRAMFRANGKRTSTTVFRFVGKFLTEEWLYDGANTLQLKTIYKRNAQGNILEKAARDANGKLKNNSLGYALQRFQYDASGNVIEETYLDETEKVFQKVAHTIDAQGNTTQSLRTGGAGELLEKSVYTYDAHRRVTRVAEYDEEGLQQTRTFKYDAGGRVIEQATFGAKNMLKESSFGIAVVETSYDAFGNLIEEKRFDGARRLKILERYNDFGLLAERIIYSESGVATHIERRLFDRYGNLTEERQLRQDEQTRAEIPKETRFFSNGSLTKRLTFDKAGNLLKETTR